MNDTLKGDTDNTFKERVFDWKVAQEIEALLSNIKTHGVVHIAGASGDANSTPFTGKLGRRDTVYTDVLDALQREVDRLRLRCGVSRND